MSVWKYEKNHLIVKRLCVLGIFFALIGFVLFCRLFYLQILQGDKFFLMAEKNRLAFRLTIPERGKILDRNGVVLADNAKTFQAVLIKEQAPDFKVVLNRFSKLLPLSEEELASITKEVARKRPFMPVQVKDNLTLQEVALLYLNAPDLPGIQIEEGMIRTYPQRQAYAHTIGYVSLFSDSDASNSNDPLLDLPGYRIGRTGLEKSHGEVLKGTPGKKKIEINAAGRTIRLLERTKPVSGQEIQLTIDNRLQNFTQNLLKEEAASAVVVDVETGEILAMVSAPSFDPNLFLSPISIQNWNKIMNNQKKPLQNKALHGVYSPGSIFKLVVSLAGLENKTLKPTTTINCTGSTKLGKQLFHCWKKAPGHGPLNLIEAIAASCDVYFYEASQRVGAEKILEVARRLGFGSKTGIELLDEKTGLVPSFEWKKKRYNESWKMGDTYNLSIGQGFLNVTPLQIVRAVAALSNGGKLVDLHLLKGPTKSVELGFDKENLKIVKQGMFQVVNEPGATAYGSRFDIQGMKMAGKTATTQVKRISLEEREKGLLKTKDIPWEFRDHALFAGFAPTKNPRYAVVVVVEHGGGGSSVAAPLASKILQKALTLDSSNQEKEP